MAHNLAYEVLVGPIPEDLEFDHKNMIKTDNRPDNLEPVTNKVNVQRSYNFGARNHPWAFATIWRGKPKLTIEQIEIAMGMRANGLLIREIADEFSISITHAHRITS